MARNPSRWRARIWASKPVASAHAPWTRTIVGLFSSGWVAISAPLVRRVCLDRREQSPPHGRRPQAGGTSRQIRCRRPAYGAQNVTPAGGTAGDFRSKARGASLVRGSLPETGPAAGNIAALCRKFAGELLDRVVDLEHRQVHRDHDEADDAAHDDDHHRLEDRGQRLDGGLDLVLVEVGDLATSSSRGRRSPRPRRSSG